VKARPAHNRRVGQRDVQQRPRPLRRRRRCSSTGRRATGFCSPLTLGRNRTRRSCRARTHDMFGEMGMHGFTERSTAKVTRFAPLAARIRLGHSCLARAGSPRATTVEREIERRSELPSLANKFGNHCGGSAIRPPRSCAAPIRVYASSHSWQGRVLQSRWLFR
jgi:hypothetical protein